MDSSFGTRLRLQREQQHVSIGTIAADTKINPSLLTGLERDDVSHWPEGIFRRAYVRAYARAIGLDPDDVVREFLELHPDSVVVLPAGSAVWPEPDRASVHPPAATRLGRIVTTAMSAVPAMLRRPRRNGHASDSQARIGAERPVSMATEDPRPIHHDATPTVVEGPMPVTQDPAPTVTEGLTLVRDNRPADRDPVRPELSLAAAAHLCTRLGRVMDPREIALLLAEAATLLDAVGLIVWFSDARTAALTPSLVHGYSDSVLARLTDIPADAGNAVAAAFRSADVCVVDGDGVTGAVVVPLVGPGGCVGVLAVELPHGSERRESVRAFATILAAQLVTAPLARAVRLNACRAEGPAHMIG
jgi:hypothetical protein